MGEERGRGETVALIRLHIIVEGATEETFVNTVLAPELGQMGVFADTHSITTGRRHGRAFRGGFLRYEHLARDLTLWMKQDQHPESWFTTMVDLYALPADFPGWEIPSPQLATLDRVIRLEAALAQDITQRLDGLPVASRFIPYLQTHEFEALLFADASGFLEAFPGRQDEVDRLTAIRARFATPEDIDDGADHSSVEAHPRSRTGLRKARFGSVDRATHRIGYDPAGVSAFCPMGQSAHRSGPHGGRRDRSLICCRNRC